MSEMTRMLGVVAVLTHKSDYLLAPLGMNSVAGDPARVERQAQPEGQEAAWFTLKANTLGFPSGGVETTHATLLDVRILKEEITRELKEELGLDFQPNQFQGSIIAVGVIEQIRQGEFTALTACALLNTEVTDQQLELLRQRGAIKLSLADLEQYTGSPEFTQHVRPTTLLVMSRALLGTKIS